ncbi:hypothetical protein XOC_3035 [Xanthomonas oryzae pv. oryzicola BLS256]|uniref:Uncharacterized protein n=1 Tax=Xanthomonas oryzae pv. oryzicola (strain BLS256) TaxID=383407 RepID=G7TLY3_XANOB|nr:hypothetical protein XOC_3035 [Xanthomonas oryzae pv. oryzicola BLS256]QEO96754.1 hypothetical protein XOCgx_1762 [Xanthomonas oryzae pv. oryzicola]
MAVSSAAQSSIMEQTAAGCVPTACMEQDHVRGVGQFRHRCT